MFRITKETFIQLAAEIHEIFPSEPVSAYYTPYVSGQRTGAKGKLLDHYRYLKTELWKDGILMLSEAQEKNQKRKLDSFGDDAVDDLHAGANLDDGESRLE